METKNQKTRLRKAKAESVPLTISEWRSLYRNMAILTDNQEREIKELKEVILYLRNRPIEEENKKLKAENSRLWDKVEAYSNGLLNQTRKEYGLPPIGKADPSKQYLSVSKSEG